MSICLTHSELSDVTGKVRHSAQYRACQAMAIPCTYRPDGSVLVYRKDIETTTGKSKNKPEPNFDALNHVA